jgi:mannose-6-phosphate isomerase-like protein (cupin superfamily)
MSTLTTEAAVLSPGEGKVVALPGATMIFKALSGVGATDFLVGEFAAEPGFATAGPHFHCTVEELFYIVDGVFDFFIDDHVERVGPGAFVTIPPGVTHDFRNPGTSPARWLGIAAPGGLEHYFEEVQRLAEQGHITPWAMRELRLRYDTVEPDETPTGHWGAAPVIP